MAEKQDRTVTCTAQLKIKHKNKNEVMGVPTDLKYPSNNHFMNEYCKNWKTPMRVFSIESHRFNFSTVTSVKVALQSFSPERFSAGGQGIEPVPLSGWQVVEIENHTGKYSEGEIGHISLDLIKDPVETLIISDRYPETFVKAVTPQVLSYLKTITHSKKTYDPEDPFLSGTFYTLKRVQYDPNNKEHRETLEKDGYKTSNGLRKYSKETPITLSFKYFHSHSPAVPFDTWKQSIQGDVDNLVKEIETSIGVQLIPLYQNFIDGEVNAHDKTTEPHITFIDRDSAYKGPHGMSTYYNRDLPLPIDPRFENDVKYISDKQPQKFEIWSRVEKDFVLKRSECGSWRSKVPFTFKKALDQCILRSLGLTNPGAVSFDRGVQLHILSTLYDEKLKPGMSREEIRSALGLERD